MGEPLMKTAEIVSFSEFKELRARNAKNKPPEEPKFLSRDYAFSIRFQKEQHPASEEVPAYEGTEARAAFTYPIVDNAMERAMVVRDLFEVAAWVAAVDWEDGELTGVQESPSALIMLRADGRISLRFPPKVWNQPNEIIHLAKSLSNLYDMFQEGNVPEEEQKSLLETLQSLS